MCDETGHDTTQHVTSLRALANRIDPTSEKLQSMNDQTLANSDK
jgi:hypothetical protein